jgi:hypothetical protein
VSASLYIFLMLLFMGDRYFGIVLAFWLVSLFIDFK